MSEKTDELNKEARKKFKSNERLKRLFILVFILFVVFLFLKSSLKKYIEEPTSIFALVGNNISTSISVKNALILRENSIAPFSRLLEKGEYEEAYQNYCTNEYKSIYSLEDFKNFYSNIDCSTIELKDIKAKTDYCYEAKVVYKEKQPESSGDDELIETTYMLFPNEFNPEIVMISPNNFLYAYQDEEFSKNGIKIYIEKCIVNCDSIYVKGTIENTSWFSDIDIEKLGFSYDGAIRDTFGFDKTLKKGEIVEFEKKINENQAFLPNSFILERKMSETKLRTYNFFFKAQK